jgi:hypothetical protein
VQLATTDDLHELCWVAGDFTPYLHSSKRGQLQLWEKFWPWFALDSADEQLRWDKQVPPGFAVAARVYCLKISRRWGKTAFSVWILTRIIQLLRGLLGRPVKVRYTTALQQSIDTIVGEVLPDVFRFAPPSMQPQYHGKRGTKPAGLYFPEYGPAGGSFIQMAGLDKNKNALRGQGCDGDVVSEAAFIEGLEAMIGDVLYAQYQGRPWARMILESSAPDREATAWEMTYLPDAALRGAVFEATIDDNPLLDERQKEEFISAAGGRTSARCKREYLNITSVDPTLQTFPELTEAYKLAEYTRPKHCLPFTSLDPGHRDMFAILFAVYDCARAAIVIEDCWARSNASTEKVAAVVAAREYDLWGYWPSEKMARIPLRDTLDSSGRVIHLGWQSLLADDRCARHAEKLHELAAKSSRERPDDPSNWPYPHYRRSNDYEPGMLSYYDHGEQRFKIGAKRVSDINPQLINDLLLGYGLNVSATTKDDLKDTMVWNTRSKWIGRGRLLFTPRAELAYKHMSACIWNAQRTEFDHHKVYSHYDLAADGVYLTRYVDTFANVNPEPPAHLGAGGPDWIGKPEWEQTSASSPYEMF